VSDAGMGELRRQLVYKSEWYGSTLVVVDRFFPSSKLCSGCGQVKDTLSLSERVYNCDACGLVLNRDENAAINLRKLVLAQLPEGLGEVTPVEREGAGLGFGRDETALAETGSDRPPHSRRHPQIDEATRRGDGMRVGIIPTRSRTPAAVVRSPGRRARQRGQRGRCLLPVRDSKS
jgi:Putative transposase DNA-binding domain